MEIFPSALPEEIGRIAEDAIQKIGLNAAPEAVEVVKQYCSNGREAVNMIQLVAGLALTEKRDSQGRGCGMGSQQQPASA